ncbi:MAG: chemotaxis sensory histidine kinase [Pseudomonadota bacterium]
MAGFDKAKYRRLFLEEADEMFVVIETLLLQAEKEKTLKTTELSELFRAVHTLKGGASTVEYVKFTKYVHQLESFLDRLRTNDIVYRHEMVEFLIDVYDKMQELLKLETQEELSEDIFETYMQGLTTQIAISSLPQEKPKEEPKQDSTNNDFGFFDEDERYGIFMKKGERYGLFADELETYITAEEPFGFFENEHSSAPLSDDIAFGFFLDLNEYDGFGFFDTVAPVAKIDKQEEVIVKEKDIVQKSTNSTTKQAVVSNSTIRVDLVKIDALMNNIGEQVIGVSMLYQFIDSIEDAKIKSGLMERFALLERHIRELQESVMAMRMVPMEEIYSKFPKMIRDTAKKINKQIEFAHTGDNVEIDKAMVEGLTDPLMHIIRNAIDHGLETPQERLLAGKSEVGTISIGAEQANGQIVITVSDDGKGIGVEKVMKKAIEQGIATLEQLNLMSHDDICGLIFQAGLSTAEEVTDISGRGVGMDVVRFNIEKLGGAVRIKTEPNIGTKFVIALPLTLAILDGLNVSVGNSKFILPLSAIVESLQPTPNMVKALGDGSEELLSIREEYVPIVRLHKIFNVVPHRTNLCEGMLIIIKAGGQKLALFVDEFLHQQQVVIKPLDKNFRNVKGIGGATVRGDGSIGLILDVFGILDLYKSAKLHRRLA